MASLMVCSMCGDIISENKCTFCEERNIQYIVRTVNISNPIENNFIRKVKNEERLMLISNSDKECVQTVKRSKSSRSI
jgi:hypothetical protein